MTFTFNSLWGIALTFLLVFLVINITNKNKITSINYNNHINKSISKEKFDIIKGLTIQTARWSTASEQDNNPYVAVLHSDYGVGYVMALRGIATAAEIAKVTGIDILKLESRVIENQRKAALRLLKLCPKIAPNTDLAILAQEKIPDL